MTQAIERLGSEWFVFMTTTYAGGALFILFATILAWFNLEQHDDEIPMFSPLQGVIQGWFAVFIFYALGFSIIYFKWNGEI
jgi:hypothetical protein